MSELEEVRAIVNDNDSEMNNLPEREEISRQITCGAAHNSSSSSSSTSIPKLDDEEKMKRRADILYGTDKEYMKKYYGNGRDTDILNRLKNNELENLNDKIQEKTKEKELFLTPDEF